jgi:hypothetical protein
MRDKIIALIFISIALSLIGIGLTAGELEIIWETVQDHMDRILAGISFSFIR